MHHHRAFFFTLIPRPLIRRAAYVRYTDKLWYAATPEVERKFLIHIPGAVFDGSVTGVGREQDRIDRYPEAPKALRNRPLRTSKNRIEPSYSAYESEGRRFESCRARYINLRFAGVSPATPPSVPPTVRGLTGVGSTAGPFETGSSIQAPGRFRTSS